MVHYEVIVEKEYSDSKLKHCLTIERATLEEAFFVYTSHKMIGDKVSIHKVARTIIKED